MLAQLVKAFVGQADIQRFEPHLGHNWLSCGVLFVKSRHFGLLVAQAIRPNWQSLLAGGSGAIQTWSILQSLYLKRRGQLPFQASLSGLNTTLLYFLCKRIFQSIHTVVSDCYSLFAGFNRLPENFSPDKYFSI